MAINLDKPHLWKEDIYASVDQFNAWFRSAAPKAFRETRLLTTEHVARTLRATKDLAEITVEVLKKTPNIIATLRMATCPPLARDRLIGLADANKNLVKKMEEGVLAVKMPGSKLDENLRRIADTITAMLDRDIFPWLEAGSCATKVERHRAATIVADRLCGALSDPIIRNAQEKRQLEQIEKYLTAKGYRKQRHSAGMPIREMACGTFCFRMIVIVGDGSHPVNVPVDVVVQPHKRRADRMPILIEAKSAGDFTNVNKRRKEEAKKCLQLRAKYGESTAYILFLCGYFGPGYLGYEAADGIDWVWEHRIDDFERIGI